MSSPASERARALQERYGRIADLPNRGRCGMCGAQVIYAAMRPERPDPDGMRRGVCLDAEPIERPAEIRPLGPTSQNRIRVFDRDGYSVAPRWADETFYREHACRGAGFGRG